MRPETEQVELFGQIILANELDGNERAAYRFSDPDGVKTGKSGWSFGRCQFDTKNNPISRQCLAACGFTPAEIDGIVPGPWGSGLIDSAAVSALCGAGA